MAYDKKAFLTTVENVSILCMGMTDAQFNDAVGRIEATIRTTRIARRDAAISLENEKRVNKLDAYLLGVRFANVGEMAFKLFGEDTAYSRQKLYPAINTLVETGAISRMKGVDSDGAKLGVVYRHHKSKKPLPKAA